MASMSAWISSSVAGVTFLTRVCEPPPLTLHGLATITSSLTAVSKIARSTW